MFMQGKTDFWNTLSPAILHKTAAILNFAPKLIGLATQYFWQQYLCTAESSSEGSQDGGHTMSKSWKFAEI